MSTVDLSERDNKETLFVKEEVTNDAEVFGEVVVDVEGFDVFLIVSQSDYLPPEEGTRCLLYTSPSPRD